MPPRPASRRWHGPAPARPGFPPDATDRDAAPAAPRRAGAARFRPAARPGSCRSRPAGRGRHRHRRLARQGPRAAAGGLCPACRITGRHGVGRPLATGDRSACPVSFCRFGAPAGVGRHHPAVKRPLVHETPAFGARHMHQPGPTRNGRPGMRPRSAERLSAPGVGMPGSCRNEPSCHPDRGNQSGQDCKRKHRRVAQPEDNDR